MKKTILLILFSLVFLQAKTQILYTTTYGDPVVAADCNNDGNLDIWIETGDYKTGYWITNDGSPKFTCPKNRNIGSGNQRFSVFADLNNDNYVDIVHEMMSQGLEISINKGNGTVETKMLAFDCPSWQSFAIEDFDNDGLKDIATVEFTNKKFYIYIYQNQGNFEFSKKLICIKNGLYYLFAKDFDNDGMQDIILGNGKGYAGGDSTLFLKNIGKLNFTEKGLIPYDCLGKAYDINADGLMDNIRYGMYLNKGNGTYKHIDINGWPQKVIDMDNDGYLDIVSETWIYQYEKINDSIFYAWRSRVNVDNEFMEAIGDFNNDRKIDIVSPYSLHDGFYLYYGNQVPLSEFTNTPPNTPPNLRATTAGDSIVFNWDRGSDALTPVYNNFPQYKTPALGLTYNLRIGSTPGACDIMSALALANGKRLVVEQGNIMNRLSYTLKNLKGGKYYFSVQTIDNSFAGSAFTTEQMIQVTGNRIYPQQVAPLQTNRKDITLEVKDFGFDAISHQWKIGTQEGVYQDVAGETGTSFSPSFSQVGTYYVVCQSQWGTQTVLSNVVKITVFAPEISLSGSIPTASISRKSGTAFTVNYNLIGTYTIDNQFVAYLSDKNGNFTNKTKLNSLVSNSSGIFTVNLPAGTPDGSNYQIRLESTNPQVTSNTSNSFTVDLNDAPTGIELTNHVSENQPIGTVFSALKAIDADAEDTFIYTALSDNTNFYIEGNSLKTSRLFDFETEPDIYTFAIKATDNHNTFCIQTFNISIDNVNEAPTLDLPSQTFSGLELGDISVTGFIINDVDAFNNPLDVTISSNDGVVKFDQLPNKRSSNSIEFQGTLSQLNEIINSLIFKSNRYFYGDAQITIQVSDLGNSGSGGVQIIEKTLNIGVVPLPPEIILQPVSQIKGCVNERATFSICADGAKPIEYQWFKDGTILYSERNNFITIDIKEDEDAGTFYCIAKNLGGQVTSNQGVLLVKSQNFDAQIANISLCSGDPTGEISVTATGGWGNYQYSIDNGTNYKTSQVFENLYVGTYSVVIKDDNNCTTTKEFTVTAPPLLKPNINAKNIACKDYKNGELNINVVGGTPPFSIDIQSISINETLNFDSNSAQKNYKNLIPDVYTINIKDQNLCDTFAVVRLTEPDKLVFTSKPSSVACYGDRNGELNFSIDGGTEPYFFYWTNSEMTNLIKDFKSGTYNLSELAKTSGLLAGKYEFYITDSQSCETSQNVDIQSPTKLEISFIDNTLIATGGTSPYEYSQNGRSFGTTNTFPNLESGIYNLTVRDANACTNSIRQFIENKIVTIEKPSVDFSFISEGLNVNLVSSIQNANHFEWNFGDGTFSSETINQHTYSKSGTYKITLTAYNTSGSTVLEKTVQILGTNLNTEIESDFTIYPNPATEEVFISYKADKILIISVFDASGRKVLETKNLHFSVKDLAKGFYTLKIENTTKKLIIR